MCPGAGTSWEAYWRTTGSKGTAIWREGKPYAETLIPSQEDSDEDTFKKIEGEYTWQGQEGHYGCLDEMFEALLEDRRPETDCRDNIKSLAMVFAAVESARKGKKNNYF